MKFAEELFPKGTFPKQQTDGAYIDETLAKNLDVIAKKIVNDMTFLGIISGHDMVGDGKTTCLTQVGTYLTNKINELHGVHNTFTDENMCFNSDELFETSFKLPGLSVVALDEGDDLTTHGMKELAVKIKRYFRKCRQLNQILILILPSFFELPKFYALSRSHFLIDVQFKGEYERGYFKFYGPIAKKLLYLKGKKEWNYDAHKSDFHGRFFSSYTFFPDLQGSITRYKERKYQDMVDDSKDNKPKTQEQLIREANIRIFHRLKEIQELTHTELSKIFNISTKTCTRWSKEAPVSLEVTLGTENVNNIIHNKSNNKIEQDDDGRQTE